MNGQNENLVPFKFRNALNYLVENTPNFTGAELESLVQRASFESLKRSLIYDETGEINVNKTVMLSLDNFKTVLNIHTICK